MNSSQPCTGYWPYTIAISPRKECSTSCNSITPISRSGLRMRPHRYQGALRSWDAFMSANNKTWRMAASTNDVTLIGVMQGSNGHVKRVRLIAGRHALGTVEVEEGRAAMTLTHAYEEMTPEKRPQDRMVKKMRLLKGGASQRLLVLGRCCTTSLPWTLE